MNHSLFSLYKVVLFDNITQFRSVIEKGVRHNFIIFTPSRIIRVLNCLNQLNIKFHQLKNKDGRTGFEVDPNPTPPVGNQDVLGPRRRLLNHLMRGIY